MVKPSDELTKDDDLPSNVLEWFVELPDVLKMIDELPIVCQSSNTLEKSYQKYSEILSRYQDQPHLLDPHLNVFIEKLLKFIIKKKDGGGCGDDDTSKRASSSSAPTMTNNDDDPLIHAAFKYLHKLSTVRTYKVLVKFLPHELSDLEFALNFLEKQSISDSETWETRYMLLLWMSILVLNPFHMSRLDAFSSVSNPLPMQQQQQQQPHHPEQSQQQQHQENNVNALTKMERIYNLCKTYSYSIDSCATVAAYLSAKYLVRTDVKEFFLSKFFNWIIEIETDQLKLGQLAAISAILKHGKREDLLPYAEPLLKWIINNSDYKNTKDFLKMKFFIKILQRLGLVFLKPRLAYWRYQRGSRSLTANLELTSSVTEQIENIEFQNNTLNDGGGLTDNIDDDENIVVPDEIESIIEELLQALANPSSDIRWSAAKGIGRVTNRLPKHFGDEVVGSVIETLNPLAPHEAWHGGCLAVAELSKRGLLLPYRLSEMVPLLLQALVYDEMKGYMTVGQHIRDAACYMSWAFARAYNPSDLQPFVENIAAGLIVTAVYDREINCRRAASAAFQESVGRLGNFPHGIDILTEADFYTVGVRVNSYLQISDFIAQYDEYTFPLIDHLINKKISHWDTAIRDLTAKTLHKLTKKAPNYMVNNILPKLFEKTDSIDVNMRHGSVLSIGEILLALRELENVECDVNKKYITLEIIQLIDELIIKFMNRDQFKGMSGEIMNNCCCNFIKNCSKAKIIVSDKCIDSWQSIIDNCLIKKTSQTREVAISALFDLCNSYYDHTKCIDANAMIVGKYLKGCENDLEEFVRMGYVAALGALPGFMLKLDLKQILLQLIKQSMLRYAQLALLSDYQDTIVCNENVRENSITNSWSEARMESIKALSGVIQTIGFNEFTQNRKNILCDPAYINLLFKCFLNGMNEYTIDDRGDIGAWVREASMNALYNFITTIPHHLLDSNVLHSVLSGFAQQAVEKIDRTRGLAGKLFCNLIYFTPTIPHIKHHEFLKSIFPEDSTTVLWLFADHTFPLFCSMLELPDYTESLLIGLIASIGQLTESLIKYSSASMFKFLRTHSDHIPRICKEIIGIFEKNLLHERITYPLLNFLDLLMSSGSINSVLLDNSTNFAEEIFRLVKLEIKGHKKLYKIVSSINVFCHLIQLPSLRIRIFSNMSIFLGLKHVHIRKSAASKFYEAMVLHGDECDIPEDNLDEILMILSETDWGLPLNECRPIRNRLCELLNIKAPITSAAPVT